MENEYLKLENICKVYNSKTEKVIALNQINYQFEVGKFYAIMGHSGSGKSTLISILGLIDRPSSGKYYLNGEDVFKLDDYKLSKLRNKEIGFIFQNFYLDEHLKAYENVMIPMVINENIPKDERKNRAITLLKKLNLEKRVNHFPKEMSGGEQQRVAIARALANEPNIILADEPTGNLDKKNENMIFEELKRLSLAGKLVIVVSHSDEIKKYADIILELKDGELSV